MGFIILILNTRKLPLLHGIEKRRERPQEPQENIKFFCARWDLAQEISK